MNVLTGIGVFCNSAVGVDQEQADLNKVIAYPSPFNSQIFVDSKYSSLSVELRNCIGQIIYSGNELSTQNFSDLPKGLYYLKLIGLENEVVRLLK